MPPANRRCAVSVQRKLQSGAVSGYWLDVPDNVDKHIDRAPGHLRLIIRRAIAGLSADPRPETAKLMRGKPERYQIRIDSWRIYYRVDDANGIVTILRVGRKGRSSTFYD
ncbi:MAG: hypothetical protein DCC55_10115 [Chloroflexi bacterium]|nr:MAG: hypothetical protein DCC55_10115 [Chloroflexota bacterium]